MYIIKNYVSIIKKNWFLSYIISLFFIVIINDTLHIFKQGRVHDKNFQIYVSVLKFIFGLV